jgi:hypothetical protein
MATGIQVSFVGPSIIAAAWQQARLKESVPSLETLLEGLPSALENARKALNGQTVRIKAVVGLSGVVLPPGTVLEFPWGCIRPTRPYDHPEGLGDMPRQRTIRQMEDGSTVAITDAGDVILVVDVPLKLRIERGNHFGGEIQWPTPNSRHELEKRVMQVRIAQSLASNDDPPPVLIPVWQRFILPVAQGGSMGVSHPSLFALRTPTALSPKDAASWKTWLDHLNNIDITRFGVAPARLLRAVAERRDQTDSLIDAVICWEALFGGDTEMTFRVSAAIARLLRPSGPDRRALRTRIAEIYRLRSKVVHGADVPIGEVVDASREAVSTSVEVFRTLVSERRDLVKMSAGERSTAILME